MSGFAYTVIDLETSIKNRGDESVGQFQASPFHPDNKIVLLGEKTEASDSVRIVDGKQIDSVVAEPPSDVINVEGTIIVGQNIGFDYLYLYKTFPLLRETYRRAMIWDTMIVEYLLSGQEDMYMSLDKLALKYGGTVKPDAIKAYWNEGIDTEKIPRAELVEYLEGDVNNTEIVFLGQIERAHRMNMLPLIRSQMDARLATIEMEWNGTYIDKEGLKEAGDILHREGELLNEEATRVMGEFFDLPKDSDLVISASSPKQLSTMLFGGVLTFHVKEHAVVDGVPQYTKSGPNKGKPKMVRIGHSKYYAGMFNDPTRYSATLGRSGMWGTGEAILKKLVEDTLTPEKKVFIESLLKIRTMEKDYSAFYKSTLELIWHDGCLHPQYQHTATATGRLSCSKPNLQQVSGK